MTPRETEGPEQTTRLVLLGPVFIPGEKAVKFTRGWPRQQTRGGVGWRGVLVKTIDI